LAQAEIELEGALGAARRAGDKSLELANLVFLACTYLRRHDVAGVEKMALLGRELVEARAFPSAAMVNALLSWVEWKRDRLASAEQLAVEALEQWRPNMVRYPFCWICLWPLVAVRLSDGRHQEAVDAARELVRPPQMRLPDVVEAEVEAAISAWDNDERATAVRRLRRSLQLAEKLRFV
jgi:hypothetical protein